MTTPHTSEVVNVDAAVTGYNANAYKAFGLSEKYMNAFDSKWADGTYGKNDLRNVNLKKDSTVTALENQTLALVSAMLDDNVGTVSNDITIHYREDKNKFYIKSGGDTIVTNIIYRAVEAIGFEGYMYAYNDNVQPKFTVKGDSIDLYVPAVYYNKETRTYLAKQISNRLKVVTGKTYKVKVRTTRKENLKVDNNLTVNSNLLAMSHDDPIYDTVIYPYRAEMEYNPKLPYYDGKTYWSNPSYLIFSGYDLADYLTDRGIDIAESRGWDYSIGECQRIALAELVYNQFINPTVVRYVFDDYTVTLRAGKTLDIEPSEEYLGYLYNEGVMK